MHKYSKLVTSVLNYILLNGILKNFYCSPLAPVTTFQLPKGPQFTYEQTVAHSPYYYYYESNIPVTAIVQS